MNLSDYESITGINVHSASETFVTAQIVRTQRILESLLGYSLDTPDTNQYVEIGKTATTCPCPEINMDTLEDPDDVEYAYRLYTYNRKDKYFMIDPATEIHAVKLVKDGLTLRTLEADDYRAHSKFGFIKYLEECDSCCWCACDYDCYCTQLAVDADWLWPDDLPNDLLQVWAEMTTWYSDKKNDIKSETLGTHSYTRSENIRAELEDHNMTIINKYAGGNGTANRIPTI